MTKGSRIIVLSLLSLIFIFTEGLRYGRGVDMIGNYGPFYLHCNRPDLWFQDMGFVFTTINQIVHAFDITIGALPFGIIFLVYATIFWICLFQFYKGYRDTTKYFLLFAIIATNFITENTIRQGVAFSFMLLGLYFLDKKKMLPMVICMVLSFFIHKSFLLAIVLILVFHKFCNKKPFPIFVTVPLFLVLEYSSNVDFVANLMEKVSDALNLGALAADKANYFTTDYITSSAENFQETFTERTFFTQTMNALFNVCILTTGYCIQKKFPNKTYLYNAIVIGVMIVDPMRLIETVYRFGVPLQVLWFVPLSQCLYYRKSFRRNFLFYFSIFGILLFEAMYYGRYVFLNPDAQYVWNL